MEENRHKHYAKMAAVGSAIIIVLHLGATSLFAVLIPSLVADLGVSVTQVALSSSFATIAAFAFSLIGSKLIAKLTPKISLLVVSALIGVYLALISTAQSMANVYIAGFLAGIIMSLGMHASIAGVISGWFREKMASVIGVIFGIASFGGAVAIMVFGQLQSFMTWRAALKGFAVVCSISGILANLLFIRKPETQSMSQSGGAFQGKPKEEGLTQGEAVKTPAFIFFILGMALSATLMAGFYTFATTFWRSYGMSATSSASFLSLLTFFGALAGLCSGFIVDKFGSKVLMIITFSGFIIGMVLICIWPSVQTVWITIISVFFIAISRPINSIPSLVLPDLFGRKAYNNINALGMAGYYAGTAISTVLVGAVAEITGSFIISFIILAVFSAISLALFMMALKLSPMKKLKAMKNVANEPLATSD
jgi:MFS family permease